MPIDLGAAGNHRGQKCTRSGGKDLAAAGRETLDAKLGAGEVDALEAVYLQINQSRYLHRTIP